MAGGIIGRFTRDVVSYDHVYYGPSDDVYERGLCIPAAQSSLPKYWDDSLTDHEVDLICGVYYVSTGLSFSKQKCSFPQLRQLFRQI